MNNQKRNYLFKIGLMEKLILFLLLKQNMEMLNIVIVRQKLANTLQLFLLGCRPLVCQSLRQKETIMGLESICEFNITKAKINGHKNLSISNWKFDDEAHKHQ